MNPNIQFILEDTHRVCNADLNIINEEKSTNGIVNRITAKTKLQDTKVNQNKRLYEQPVCEEIVRQIKHKTASNQALMEINHPFMTSDVESFKRRALTIDMNNCAAVLRDIYMIEGNIFGNFDTLTGFKGPDLTNLIVRDKIDIGFSLRMLGSVQPHPHMENVNVVQKPLTAVTYDVVLNPSHAEAKIINFLTEDYSKMIGKIDLADCQMLTESTVSEQFLVDMLQLPSTAGEVIREHMNKMIINKVKDYSRTNPSIVFKI